MSLHFHRWVVFPIWYQQIPSYICTRCGKKSWECRWFPDFVFRF